MLFANISLSGRFLVGAAAIALSGVSCAAQQANMPEAGALVSSAQVLAPGTVLNVGQGTYVVPALPPSATGAGYALTGQDTSHQYQQAEGRWIGGANGSIFIPPTP